MPGLLAENVSDLASSARWPWLLCSYCWWGACRAWGDEDVTIIIIIAMIMIITSSRWWRYSDHNNRGDHDYHEPEVMKIWWSWSRSWVWGESLSLIEWCQWWSLMKFITESSGARAWASSWPLLSTSLSSPSQHHHHHHRFKTAQNLFPEDTILRRPEGLDRKISVEQVLF